MRQYELSIIIPARNEEFLARTIQDVLEHTSDMTEVIAILDGEWAFPPIDDHPRITLIHRSVSIGQRAAINEGVRLSRAKYICKLDAHCAVEQDFDLKLMADCDYDWTVTPRLYNPHGLGNSRIKLTISVVYDRFSWFRHTVTEQP